MHQSPVAIYAQGGIRTAGVRLVVASVSAAPGDAAGSALGRWLVAACIGLDLLCSNPSFGQTSPELAMRDFSSGQIKKGVRSIGFGGDGATWGNYGLVWRDAGTALADYGETSYTNGNDFHFVALGATSPPLWNDLAVYLIALNETSNTVQFD